MHKRVLLLALLVPAAALAADDANTFSSVTFGFEITKPADWHFMTAEEHYENLRRTDLKDEEFQELMIKYSTAPLVAMTKYREPYEDLNPSIKINVKPYGQFRGMDAKDILAIIVPQLESLFEDFEIVQGPADGRVAGIKSGYVRMHYSLSAPDGTVYPTASELWVVPNGDYFFMIGVGTRQDEKTGKRKEIRKILKTIKI